MVQGTRGMPKAPEVLIVEGRRIFLEEAPDASRFGVATLAGKRVTKIVEKPQSPETNQAVTGAYIYDASVFDIIKGLERSAS